MAFEPAQYTRTTCRQWPEDASGWNAWAPLPETWPGDATDPLLGLAELSVGRILVAGATR